MTYYHSGERQYTFEDMPGSYITNLSIAHEVALNEASLRDVGGAALSTEVTEYVSERSIWDSLTPEKRIIAESAITTMAGKFNVATEDFILLSTRRASKKTVTVAYAGFGIDMAGDHTKPRDERRNYHRITSYATDFIIDIDGLLLDTRAGMTWNAYQELIVSTKERGIAIPTTDRTLTKMSAFQQNTSTLLTGMKLTDNGKIWHGYTDSDGEPHKRTLMSSQGLNYRFRPAVVLH